MVGRAASVFEASQTLDRQEKPLHPQWLLRSDFRAIARSGGTASNERIKGNHHKFLGRGVAGLCRRAGRRRHGARRLAGATSSTRATTGQTARMAEDRLDDAAREPRQAGEGQRQDEKILEPERHKTGL